VIAGLERVNRRSRLAGMMLTGSADRGIWMMANLDVGVAVTVAPGIAGVHRVLRYTPTAPVLLVQ